MKRATFLLFLFLTASALFAQGEKPAFWDDIQAFKKQDSLKFPGKNAILFVGSSSFTKWTDVQDYFPRYSIINRGFGGSSLPDVIRYANDIIFPYQPKQVVIYCGENDLASSDTVTSKTVVGRFKILFALIRKKLPRTPVAFISLKPSPSRQMLLAKMIDANAQIQKFLQGQKRAVFIDVYKEMITDEGKPRAELFIEDNLHMNKQGYMIWQRTIEPYLVK